MLPLRDYKLKDMHDILLDRVNKEDKAEPFMPPTPKFVPKRIQFTDVSLHAFQHCIKKFTISLLP